MSQPHKRSNVRTFLTAAFMTIMIILVKPLGHIDRVWSDVILTSKKTPISQQYLIVEVTPQDIEKYNERLLPRRIIAKALTHMDKSGAERIVLDMTLSEALETDSDPLLISAMKALGPDRLALPYGSDPKFTVHTTPVDLDLLRDKDGWTRHVRTKPKKVGGNPALWLATGQNSNTVVKVDLRYDLTGLERVSLTDMLESPNLNLSGRHIILSPNIISESNYLRLPLSAESGRTMVIALGAQSISAGYTESAKWSFYVQALMAFIFMSLGIAFASKINRFRFLILMGFVISLVAVFANLELIKVWGGQAHPVRHFLSFLVGLVVTICYRLRLTQMIGSFLKGDLSPEEAWAWRSHQDSPSPVLLLDTLGNIRRMNGPALKIENSLGANFGQRCLAELRQPTNNLISINEAGVDRRFSLEFPNPSVAIVIMKDVTQRAREFDALRTERQVLQKSVEVITQTQNQALELASTYKEEKIRSDEVSELKSKFLANMSHELRTPLNAIIGFSDIMQREMFGPLGDPRYKTYAGDVLLSGQHLLSLINDILDLSKIEAGKMKLNIESVQISELIAVSVRILHIRAQEKQINLIYEEMVLPPAHADSRAIKQVILNLMTNAIKFTPEGGVVKITTQLRQTDMLITVADNGVGISQENIKRLATPFEQVVDGKSPQQEGTGLGLALAKSMVELQGGQFRIDSVLGQGTAVTFTLPIAPSQIQLQTAPTQNHGNPQIANVG